MNKQFTDVKITTEHKSYADTSYAYDDNDRTLPNLVSGEQIGDSLGKIKRWIDQRKQVIIGELSDGTGIIKSQYLPSYVDDVIDCYYDSEDTKKMYEDAEFTTAIPYPSDLPAYTLLTAEPSDWSTNYTDYYTKSGDTYTPVPEGASAPTWTADTYYRHNTDGDGVKGKIYQDLGASPLPVFYRWTGNGFARTGSGDAPPIYEGDTAGLVGPSTHQTDKDRYFLGEDGSWLNTSVLGARAATFTLLAEEPDDWATDYTSYYTYDETKAHNQYTPIPSGDSAPTFETDTYYAITTAVAAGKTGFVPAPDESGYTEYQNLNNQFLRADGTWSNAPVITADTLTLNCKVYNS